MLFWRENSPPIVKLLLKNKGVKNMKTQEDRIMIHNLKYVGLSNSEIAKQLNMDRKTASKYLKSKKPPGHIVKF